MKSYEFILAPIFGWVAAQGIKFVLTLRKDGLQLRDLYVSGGFPSSHTALTVALTTVVGISEGVTSPLFAVSAAFTSVVMYDSIGVRRSTGEHTALLKKLTKDNKSLSKEREGLHIFYGHTPEEVLGGLALGICIGCLTAVIF